MSETDIKEEIKSQLRTAIALGDAIRELRQVPSGKLYARVMGTLTLEQYQKAIETLKNTGLVREEQSQLLVWIGDSCEKGVGR